MISIIVAVSRNGVIGDGKQMPWHISEDLRRFKQITSGHPVIMGRKTFESLGRPLPGRENIVITRRTDYTPQGVRIVNSLEEAAALCEGHDEAFIIGGGEIYLQAMPLADKLYITVVDENFEGETKFPIPDPADWTEIARERHERGKDFPHPFEFIDYIRKEEF